jgi:hypothetical protein
MYQTLRRVINRNPSKAPSLIIMIHVLVDPKENISTAVNPNNMDLERANTELDDLVKLAESTTVIHTLTLMGQYMSLYHSRRDDESLTKMNYCMLILLMKQGLFDIEQTRKDMSFVVNQRELLQMVKDFKS